MVATQAGTGSPQSAVSAASIWGLAEPELAGWADWEIRPVLEWAPRSAQGCEAQFKVSGPRHPQPCIRGGPCPPPPPGRQPCKNLRGCPPTASSCSVAQLSFAGLRSPPQAPYSVPRPKPCPVSPQTLPGAQVIPLPQPRAGPPSPCLQPRSPGPGGLSPAPCSQPSPAHGVWITCHRPRAAGSRSSSTRSTPSC